MVFTAGRDNEIYWLTDTDQATSLSFPKRVFLDLLGSFSESFIFLLCSTNNKGIFINLYLLEVLETKENRYFFDK